MLHNSIQIKFKKCTGKSAKQVGTDNLSMFNIDVINTMHIGFGIN